MKRPSLDWSDPIAVSKWLGGLRVSLNDADAAVLDMLRPPRKRALGPALHARNYTDARAQILFALDYATAPEPEPEPDDGTPSDPAGSGSAGPVHGGTMTTIRVYPTGFASESWRVKRDGEHIADVRLTIDATGRGEYQITRPDRPDLGQWMQLACEGTFTFDVWDRAAVLDVLGAIARQLGAGAKLAVDVKRPSR